MHTKTEGSFSREPVVIKTEALTRKYGKISAVDSINLEVKEGEIFGLLGPNGAGKTTLISMLCTILKPTSGRAWVNGFDIVKEPGKVRKSIGIVFQAPSVDDLLTGRENLQMHNLLFGVPREIRKQRIHEVLSIVNLEKRADELVNTYSGGMRRRLELARGIMHHPKILFLDEPTLGLDPQTREHIWEYIRKIEEKDGLLYISIKDASKHLQDLLTHTGPIDFVEVRSGTLNDVFMHYTGREIREAEAEGGFWERMMKK